MSGMDKGDECKWTSEEMSKLRTRCLNHTISVLDGIEYNRNLATGYMATDT